MSDIPPPPFEGAMPPPPPAPPPPPPAVNLTTPPGYAGYSGGLMGAVSLKRIGGLTTASIVLVVISAALGLIALFATFSSQDAAQRFLDGRIDEDEFLTDIAAFALLGVVQGLATVASGVVVVIWMFRIAANHRSLHRSGTWGPAWAIVGWILPPALYIIPFLMFRELWKASSPDTPLGQNWRSNSVSPVVPIWFVLFSVLPLLLTIGGEASTFGGLRGSSDAIAESIVGSAAELVVPTTVNVLAAGAFVVMARELSRRHRALTGEIAA